MTVLPFIIPARRRRKDREMPKAAFAVFALLFILLQTSALFGQAAYIKAVDSGTVTAAKSFTHINVLGELNYNLEYVFSGTPTTNTITLQGCMRGGTCQTLSSYTAPNTNTVISATGLYDSFVISATFTGGTNPSVTVNWLGTANSSPGSLLIDPCQSPGIAKKTAFANITTATTTSLVTAAATQTIYVCGFVATMTGTTTADTFLLETGDTGGSCANPVVQTATFNSGVLTSGATVVSFTPSMTMFNSALGKGLCALSTVATSPTINLTVVYVQI